MCTAYSSKVLSFPAVVLKKYLLYNNMKEVLDECEYYGISVNKDSINFMKGRFNSGRQEVNIVCVYLVNNNNNNGMISVACKTLGVC